jgi:hypothetical protein
MSQENVEIVRRAWKAALEDPPDWETLDYLVDPRHRAITLVGQVEGADEALGVAGWRQFRDRMNQAGEWSLDIEKVYAAPDDRVVVLGRFQLRGDRSGAQIDAARGIVQTLDQGRLTQTEVFPTPAEALQAAGLWE